MELHLTGVMAFRETGGDTPRPNGSPLDVTWLARDHPFGGEPYKPAELPGCGGPTAVVSDKRDLRTPRPIAEPIVDLAPDAALVPWLASHTALDNTPRR